MRPFVKVIIPINYYQRYQIQILLLWTSTGSGSFDNVNVEDPIYTLSPGDKTSGSVSFTVTASQPGCAADSDTMVLTIQKNPIAMRGRHCKFVKVSPLQLVQHPHSFQTQPIGLKVVV